MTHSSNIQSDQAQTQVQTQAQTQTQTQTDAVSAAAALRDWIDALIADGASPRTCAAYRRDVASLLDYLARRGLGADLDALRRVDARALRGWLAELRRGRGDGARPRRGDSKHVGLSQSGLSQIGLSQKSVARALSAVRGFYAHIERRWGDAGAGGEAIAALRAPIRSPWRPRPVSEPDAAALLRTAAAEYGADRPPWIAARDAAVLTLLYAMGLRISEALSLRGRHAPLGHTLGETLRVTGKGGKERDLPVLPIAQAAVGAYLDLCSHPWTPEGPLFRAVRGGALYPEAVTATIRRLRADLGLGAETTPHALRHAFASHLLAAGGGLRAIQTCLATPDYRRLRATPPLTITDSPARMRPRTPRACARSPSPAAPKSSAPTSGAALEETRDPAP